MRGTRLLGGSAGESGAGGERDGGRDPPVALPPSPMPGRTF